MLFKHKGKILVCAAHRHRCGGGRLFPDTPLYESQAKLLVRYVVDTSAIDPANAGNSGKSARIINSEMQIFTSWDLAMQVAKAIGPKRLAARSRDARCTALQAARSIRLGLTAIPLGKESNVIVVSYRNRDPELATSGSERTDRPLFFKHLEVHRSAEAFNFVTQQSDQVRARLNQTEEELKQTQGQSWNHVPPGKHSESQCGTCGRLESAPAAETEQAEQGASFRKWKNRSPARTKANRTRLLRCKQRSRSTIPGHYRAIGKFASDAIWSSFPDTLKRPISLRLSTSLNALDRFALRALDIPFTAQASRDPGARDNFRGRGEGQGANDLRVRRYRRQNDSGFSLPGRQEEL